MLERKLSGFPSLPFLRCHSSNQPHKPFFFKWFRTMLCAIKKNINLFHIFSFFFIIVIIFNSSVIYNSNPLFSFSSVLPITITIAIDFPSPTVLTRGFSLSSAFATTIIRMISPFCLTQPVKSTPSAAAANVKTYVIGRIRFGREQRNKKKLIDWTDG